MDRALHRMADRRRLACVQVYDAKGLTMIDRIFNSMLRGFGWGIGRRAASRMPLIPAIVVIAALYWLKHGA